MEVTDTLEDIIDALEDAEDIPAVPEDAADALEFFLDAGKTL